MTFTGLMNQLLAKSGLPPFLGKFYVDHFKTFNYAFICGIGFIIHYSMLSILSSSISLFLADAFAVLIAWRWNYENSIGLFSKWWMEK